MRGLPQFMLKNAEAEQGRGFDSEDDGPQGHRHEAMFTGQGILCGGEVTFRTDAKRGLSGA